MPSPSATISRASAVQTSRSAAANCSSRAGLRSTPLAPFASSTTASFVEHSPSTEIRLKLSLDRRPQELDRLSGLERIVGRDDREHRREPRVDHPRALRHPPDHESVTVDGGLLRPAIGGHDRLRRRSTAVVRERRPPPHARPRAHAPSAAALRSRRSRERRSPRAGARAQTPSPPRSAPHPRDPPHPSRHSRHPRSRRPPAAGRPRDARFETTTGAARMRLVVQTAAPTAGVADRTSARSGPDRRMPA